MKITFIRPKTSSGCRCHSLTAISDQNNEREIITISFPSRYEMINVYKISVGKSVVKRPLR
jgi:hypothetical protein